MSCDSFASGRSSHYADDEEWNQPTSRTAGVGADHEVLKKMAQLEAQVAQERRARLDMEDQVSELKTQLSNR